jgi:hypothetical protein
MLSFHKPEIIGKAIATQRWHVASPIAAASRRPGTTFKPTLVSRLCPTEKHKRFRHGRKVIYETALFPRYLFAKFDRETIIIGPKFWPSMAYAIFSAIMDNLRLSPMQ